MIAVSPLSMRSQKAIKPVSKRDDREGPHRNGEKQADLIDWGHGYSAGRRMIRKNVQRRSGKIMLKMKDMKRKP